MPENENDGTSHADVGIVYALPIELAPFCDLLQRRRKTVGDGFSVRGGRLGQTRVALVEAGVGHKRAGHATRALLEGHTPDWVISAGFAGALVEAARLGDIVMADRIVGPNREELAIDLHVPAEELKKAPRLHVGGLVTVDALVQSAEEKRSLGRETGALAVDMESWAVADVCRQHAARYLAIRAISDTVQETLPPEVFSVLGASRAMRLGAALGALWKRPESYKELWRLRQQARYAADRLAAFLQSVVEQLT